MALRLLDSGLHYLNGIDKIVHDGPYTDDSSGTNAGNGGSPYPVTPTPHTVTSPARFPGGRSVRHGDTLTNEFFSTRSGVSVDGFPASGSGGGFRIGRCVYVNPNTTGLSRYLMLFPLIAPFVQGGVVLIADGGANDGKFALKNAVVFAPPPSSGWQEMSSAAISYQKWERLELDYFDPEGGNPTPPARDITTTLYLNGIPIINRVVNSTTPESALIPAFPAFRAFFISAFGDLSTHYPDGIYTANDYILDRNSSTIHFLNDPDFAFLKPGGAGTYSDSSIGGTSPAATRHESVGEALLDDGTSLVSFNAAGQHDSYVIETLPDESEPVALQLVFRARLAGAGTGTLAGLLRSAGGVDATTMGRSLDSTWRTYSIPLDVSPFTGIPWSPAEVEGVQVGTEVLALSGTTVEVSQVGLEVAYQQGSASVMHMKTLD